MPHPSPEIVIYSAAGPSRRAREILTSHGLPFREVATFRPDAAQGYCVGPISLPGRRPVIRIDGTDIRGLRGLARLDRAGVLEAIAAGRPFPILAERTHMSRRSVLHWGRARIAGDQHTPIRATATVLVDRFGRLAETRTPTDQIPSRSPLPASRSRR